MGLRLFNSLSRQKEDFLPLEEHKVKMYCCGPTVYGLLHVGNFRGPVVYNLLRNWLRHLGYEVNYVYNFTDVDDKIIERAKVENKSASEISEHYIKEFWMDFSALKLTPHSHNPKVTEYMGEIIKFISQLIELGNAYEAEGDVLFSVRSFEKYGELSGRKIEDLQSGHRIEVDKKKRDPLDFALWKAAKPGEVAWPSPWGNGRPGWHIECSAMTQAILGDQIDIHGGGMDLYFPHHENEIAQSEACHHKKYVKYWVHNNMFNFGGAKMSKSLGNVLTMRGFLEQYPAEIYKFLTLAVHHRSEADFSDDTIESATKGLAKFYSSLKLASQYTEYTEYFKEASAFDVPKFKSAGLKDTAQKLWTDFENSMNDDLNTPMMMAHLHELTKNFNSKVRAGMKPSSEIILICQDFIQFFAQIAKITAVFVENPSEFLYQLDEILLAKMQLQRPDIQKIVDARWQAKLAKDFKTADELRAELTRLGIAVQDLSDRSEWEVAK